MAPGAGMQGPIDGSRLNASVLQQLAGREILSVKEVALLLGKSEKTVRRWVAAEFITVVKAPGVNGTLMFSRTQVLRKWEQLQGLGQ